MSYNLIEEFYLRLVYDSIRIFKEASFNDNTVKYSDYIL